jgi:replicative DNA helicase
MTSDLIPASDTDAEQAVLGSMMLDRRAIHAARQVLTAGDFYRPAHATIFDAMCALDEREQPVDLITLQNEVNAEGKLENVGGTEYLMALVSQVPSASRVEHYARLVKDKKTLRELAVVGAEIGALAHDGTDAAQAVEQAMVLLSNVSGERSSGGLAQALPHRDILAGALPGVRWLVEPLIPADGITILAGDSGVYKSWTAYHLAQCVAAGSPFLGRFDTEPGRVLVFDAESGENLMRRRAVKLWNGLAADRPELDPDIPLSFVPSSIRLETPEQVLRLVGYLRDQGTTLCIVDPLIHALPGEENSSVEMARFFENVRCVQKETGACFLFVHHSRKRSYLAPNEAGQMLRGSSAIRAILDSHLFLRKLKTGRLLCEHDKSRHAEPVENFLIEIEDVDECSTVVRYGGQAEEAVEKGEVAAAFINRALTDAAGSLTRQEILAQAKGANLASRTVCQVLTAGVENGWLAKDKPGGKQVVYHLTVSGEEV